MNNVKNIMKRVTAMILAVMMLVTVWLPSEIQVEAAKTEEYKAVWFQYNDFKEFYLNKVSKNNATNFTTFFREVVTNCKDAGFNTIIVHVRPFGDALYKSSIFPTSEYIAGRQGKKIYYDPLKIMVSEAHKQGLRIEAWINPYRVAFSTNYYKLSRDNPARKWHSKASTRRNVLSYNGCLYYNPAKTKVRSLIISGVKEIVLNYKVDGIHMDDYFYPSFSSKDYYKVFDAPEYKASRECKAGIKIAAYRRKQVSLLVKGIRRVIKAIRPNVTFGISPAGNIDNLNSKYQYYVDIPKWVNSKQYVDYICPQIYWGFNHATAKYDKVLDRWKAMTNQRKVKLYIGLPAYKLGMSSASTAKELKEFRSATVLQNMIIYGREQNVDGFAVFDYRDLFRSSAKKAMKKMTEELEKSDQK